jgi:hypothetical protein
LISTFFVVRILSYLPIPIAPIQFSEQEKNDLMIYKKASGGQQAEQLEAALLGINKYQFYPEHPVNIFVLVLIYTKKHYRAGGGCEGQGAAGLCGAQEAHANGYRRPE